MSDLERALRDTLAHPPVEVAEPRHPEDGVLWRLERRRSRQKRAAVGIGVAAAIAAVIAVPATTMDFSGGSGSNRSSADRAAVGAGSAHGNVVTVPVPAAVRTTAQELAREYGVSRIDWVRTTTAAWTEQQRLRSDVSGAKQTLYVLQVRNFHCTKNCPTQPQSTGTSALVTTVDASGKRGKTAIGQPVRLSALGPVHTFTAR